MKQLESIKETTYLTAIKSASCYRRIMRVFFLEYEKMRFQLYKEEVMELLQTYPEFSDYSMDQLKLDLDVLVGWKNLTPIQDPKRVYTIADYKNKQYRYSMSEYAVEIERLTLRLENLFLEAGNLSPSYFVRIEEAVSQAQEKGKGSLKEINEWWHNLQEDFKRLNQNYQDYLREFYSGRSDKVLKSLEFILYKDRFIAYLKDFIKELQTNTMRIENMLRGLDEKAEQQILEKVINSELDIPHPNSENRTHLEEYVRGNIHGKWNALKRWFLPLDGNPSESSRVLEITNEVIRKIIQNAALIIQLHNWGLNRKEDYRKFIRMFNNCPDLEEAHKLASHLFGIQSIRHFKVNSEHSTDSINSSVYEEEPIIFPLKPKTRAYRARVDKSGFESKAMEKLAQRNQYLKQVEDEQKMVFRYIKDNQLILKDIREQVPSQVRITLLRWISAANMTGSRSGRTEYGQAYKLIKTDGSCTLRCEDGDLTMPAYIFEFM